MSAVWRDWQCVRCDATNYAIRVRCRFCLANRAAFHPDPDIDDEAWRDHWAGEKANAKAGLAMEVR